MEKINSIITKKTAGTWLQMGLIDYKQWANMCNPDYARFKAVVYWLNTGFQKPFYSLEGEENGNEEKAFDDLYRRIVNKIPPHLYKTITVFMNDTTDLRTVSRNYNYTLSIHMNGLPAVIKPIRPFFYPNGKVDLETTKGINHKKIIHQ